MDTEISLMKASDFFN